MNKNAYYFPHDMDAVSDPKLQAVLRLKGMEGIGAFWCLLERLYRQNGVLYVSEIPAMAWSLHTSEELLRSVISDFGLFEIDGDEVTSRSASARLAERRAKLEQKRAAASKGGKRTQSKRIAETSQTDSESKANAQADAQASASADAQVRKGKERKGNKKEDKSSILEESKKKNEELSFVDEMFRPAVETWLKYKRTRRESYKSQDSLEKMVEKLIRISGGDPQTAERIISEAMSNNYSGFFPLKDNSNGNGKSLNGKTDRAGSSGYVPDYSKTSF